MTDETNPVVSSKIVQLVFAVGASLLALALMALLLTSIGWAILYILTHMPLIGA